MSKLLPSFFLNFLLIFLFLSNTSITLAAPFGTPELSIDPTKISQTTLTEDPNTIPATITIRFPDPKVGWYTVHNTPVGGSELGQLTLTCTNNKEPCYVNNLSGPIDDSKYDPSTNTLTFKMFGWRLREGTTYKISIDAAGKSTNISGTYTVASLTQGDLQVKISPDTLDENKTQGSSVNVQLINGTNDHYEILFQRDKVTEFTCNGNNCSVNFTIPNKLSAGAYDIIAQNSSKTMKGSGVLTVTKVDNGPPALPPPGGAGMACTNGKDGIQTALGCVPTEPTKFITAVSQLATGAGGGIALLLMIAGVFRMMTSAGNPDGVKAGSEQFTSALIGLLFIIFAVLLLKVIGVSILNLPGFGPI